ncbi:ATP-binding protein [Roseibium sp. RKSG952]|uniref:ATP-binding protein n=1 Tax=Roseibium sp. RKSG952 TaxID=2529384 RepID=UPI0012BC1C80|nr:ATP-binding protein [Roseibium sp. RKSG952]MTH98380.1 HAMP domain-containing protein [Roseibium sp. RKSG952]
MKHLSWKTLIPSSLAGQLIALLLFALVAAQVISIWVFHDERKVAVMQVVRDNLLSRAVSVAELIEETPDSVHDRVLSASSSRYANFWVAPGPIVSQTGESRAEQRLRGYLNSQFQAPRDVRINIESEAPRDRPPKVSPEQENTPETRAPDRKGHRENWRKAMRREIDLTMSIPLEDGRWLNVATSYRPPEQPLLPLMVQLGITALAIIVIVGFAARRIARPLRELAGAADRLGRGEDIPELTVAGPREVRAVTLAFNDMQARLTRFVRDRTRMLAAISHDLRTPITSLRLRAEFIEDDENREKIIETLDEMAAMTEATLAFARDEAAREDAEETNLADLLESLAGDQTDLGHTVTFPATDPLVITCRPISIKRALRNLIENAIRYGGDAEVSLAPETGNAVIRITDNGPGIPEDRLQDVFEPFVRLEESRSEETGGIGLGLAITRSIIHAHGGTITLKNRPEGGLEAEVRLPA